MPDLKSELKKLENLRFDDGDDETPPTNNTAPQLNMTQSVFEYFRLNPMSTGNDCADALGYDKSRVAALALQLVGRKLLTRTKRGEHPYEYTAIADSMPDTYQARKAALIKAHEARSANAAKRRKAAAKKAVKVDKVEKPEERETKAEHKAFNAAMLVNSLSPFQAKAVFDELKKLFGG